MATKIPWTDATWNPIIGCTKISDGCANCYAERMAGRLAGMAYKHHETQDVSPLDHYIRTVTPAGRWTGHVALQEDTLKKPLRWRKPKMIFVCSMGDLFHESVPFEWIDRVFAVMALCPQHTFQVLTKRAERMKEYFDDIRRPVLIAAAAGNGAKMPIDLGRFWAAAGWPLPNVWLGVTAENQAMADQRIPVLLQIPAAVRFVSVEPMLESVDLAEFKEGTWQCKQCGFVYNFGDCCCNRCGNANAKKTYTLKGVLDWLIVGCESGPNRRFCKIEWIEDIVHQCKTAGVPVFVKQLPVPKVAKRSADAMPVYAYQAAIDEYGDKVSDDPADWPQDLRVQQWPKVITGQNQ